MRRYSLQNIQNSRLTWHGGGEPTLSWQMLKEASLYHREQAIALGIKPQLSIVSNGVWTKKIKEYINSYKIPVIALPENSGLVIEENNVLVLGYSKVIIFDLKVNKRFIKPNHTFTL